MLPDVDRAAFAGALAHRLRRTGVEVGLTGIEAFARALAAPPPTVRGLYWLARVTLVQHPGDLETFDAVFATVFGGASLGVAPAARRGQPAGPPPGRAEYRRPAVGGAASDVEVGEGLPWATLPPPVAPAADEDGAAVVPERLPSRRGAVAGTPFALLDPADLALVDRWLAAAFRRWPTRRSRRGVGDHRGRRVGLRPTVARARRTGFEPAELVRTGPRRRARAVAPARCRPRSQSRPLVRRASFRRRSVPPGAAAVDLKPFDFPTNRLRGAAPRTDLAFSRDGGDPQS